MAFLYTFTYIYIYIYIRRIIHELYVAAMMTSCEGWLLLHHTHEGGFADG